MSFNDITSKCKIFMVESIKNTMAQGALCVCVAGSDVITGCVMGRHSRVALFSRGVVPGVGGLRRRDPQVACGFNRALGRR